MGNGSAGDPGIYANPPGSSGRGAQPQPTATQMHQAGSKYKLHSYSDGGAGLVRMLRDLFGNHDQNAVDALDPAAVQGLQQDLYKRSAPAAPTAFYRGMSHQQLYNSVTQSVDPGQLGDMASAWNQSSEELLDASQGSASQVLAASELTWQGQAGENARASVAQLANHAGQVGQAAQVSAQLYQQQSTALSHAKNSIPKPPAQPFNAAAAQQRLTTVTDPIQYMQLAAQDHAQFVAQQQAQQQAAQIVEQYDKVVTQTSRNQPAFAPAPQVAKQAPNSTTMSGTTVGGTAAPHGGGFAPHLSAGSGSGVPNVRSGPGGGVSVPHVPTGSTNVGNTGPQSGTVPRQTSTSDYTPPGTLPNNPYGNGPYGGDTYGPSGPGGGPNPGELVGGGMIPPVGGGPGLGGVGGDMERTGSGFGPGAGGLGSGGGAGTARGGGAAGGGPGSGARSGAGAAAAEEAAVERGAAGARGATGLAGGMAPGARGGKGGEDAEHKRASYLTEPDPDDIFGPDERTVPPVIG